MHFTKLYLEIFFRLSPKVKVSTPDLSQVRKPSGNDLRCSTVAQLKEQVVLGLPTVAYSQGTFNSSFG